MTPEARVKKDVKAILKELDVSADPYKVGAHGWYFMPVAGRFGKKGTPDFICNVVGYFVAIETKAAGGVPTDLQALTLCAITASNGIGLVVDETNIGQVKSLLNKIIHGDRTEGLRLSWRRKPLLTSKANRKGPGSKSKAPSMERDRDWQDVLGSLGH